MFGYANIPRHTPTWPQPGHLTSLQRSRRLVKSVLCGIGASEGWTNTFVSEEAHRRVGLTGPAVRVSNPLIAEEPFLRRSLMPGLLGALAYNAGRRQGAIRLFEVGVVFSHPDEGRPRVVERSGSRRHADRAAPRRARAARRGLRLRRGRRHERGGGLARPGRRLPAGGRAPGRARGRRRRRCPGCTRPVRPGSWSRPDGTGGRSARWGRSTPTWPSASA